MRIPSLLAATVLAAALWGCERAEPPGAPAPAETAGPGEPAQVPAVAAEPAAVVLPPFDPSLPSLELQPAPPPHDARAAAPKPHRKPAPEKPAATTAKAEPDHPSLEALFRTPYPAHSESTSIELVLHPPAPTAKPVAPKPPHALDRLGDNIRLERRGEAIGPAGPRQGTAWETDAALRIPVDESVSLEGGVRVDSRDEPGAKAAPARKTPRVGVEVRF
jgi:hypothetical protein